MAYKTHYEGKYGVDCPYCAASIWFEPSQEEWTEDEKNYSHIYKTCGECGKDAIICADGELDCYFGIEVASSDKTNKKPSGRTKG